MCREWGISMTLISSLCAIYMNRHKTPYKWGQLWIIKTFKCTVENIKITLKFYKNKYTISRVNLRPVVTWTIPDVQWNFEKKKLFFSKIVVGGGLLPAARLAYTQVSGLLVVLATWVAYARNKYTEICSN